MKTVQSYLRVILIVILAYFLLEIVTESGEEWAYAKYPILWAVLAFVLVFAIAIEISVGTLDSVLYRSLDSDKKEKYDLARAQQKDKSFGKIKRIYANLLGSKPLEEEHEIILDHNYDGIKELDNKLPPWWVYSFYATIIFAVIYLAKYHVFQGDTQEQEYVAKMAQADLEVAEYKKTAKNLVDINSVVVLTEESDLKAGKTVFAANCVACHKADGGGGIGPNLTDPNWILGGGIKNVFNTISEGGRAGKGMIPWKTELKPIEMAQVASYILTLEGTTPAEPKKAEGDIWVNPDAEVQVDTNEVTEQANDSIPVVDETPDN
ncbi:MAG: cbb3-type cytochrome c oxidase N-terminal domain-containing protein [Gilvibacter sp.]